jgi:hypothetical protein
MREWENAVPKREIGRVLVKEGRKATKRAPRKKLTIGSPGRKHQNQERSELPKSPFLF